MVLQKVLTDLLLRVLFTWLVQYVVCCLHWKQGWFETCWAILCDKNQWFG